MEEHREKVTEFINVYRGLPALWCAGSPEYKNLEKKREANAELLLAYQRLLNPQASLQDAKSKINILRTNFRRERNKQLAAQRLSLDNNFTPSLWYFDNFQFLVEEAEYKPEINGANISVRDYKTLLTPKIGTQQSWGTKQGSNSNNLQEQKTITNSSTKIHTGLFLPKKRKRSSGTDKGGRELIQIAREFLCQGENESEIISKGWAMKLQKMDPEQKLYAEKAINDILIGGQLGLLNLNSFNLSNV